VLPVRDVRLDDRAVVREDEVERLGRRRRGGGQLGPRRPGRDLRQDVVAFEAVEIVRREIGDAMRRVAEVAGGHVG